MTTDNQATLEQLESRLHRGWDVIDEAMRANDERAVDRFTRRWLALLDEYERLAQPDASPAPRTAER